ncbi:MAG: hypothetical protein CO022_10040 [Flavobacteriales bacterium CG_4_9_14_0_2_um_filter_32_27]|nr:MAG: hypothetical protein CO022_10040 [Flavobacteriales bacterium CG_4_9_14_0_2_um_filter_32_27]
MKFKRTYLLLSFLLVFGFSKAQNIRLSIQFNDTSLTQKQQKELFTFNASTTFAGLKNELININRQLSSLSFLTNSADSIIVDSSNFVAYFHLGKQYKWTSLRTQTIDEGVLSKIGFRDKLYNNKPFNQKQLHNFYEKVIAFYENNGYPFASIRLDSVVVENNTLSGLVHIEKNNLYKIDSVIIKGTATVSDQYIKNYIRIKENDLYNESAVRKMSTRIKELPFVAEVQPPKIYFNEKNAKIVMLLKKKNASRFNGILGIVPDENGKVRLNGDVKLNLMNSFRKGEEIGFNWRAIQNNAQDLKLNLVYPFLLNSPFGLDYSFNLYKKDSTYIDIFNKIGVRYILKGNNYFSLFYHNKTSNLLTQTGFSSLTVLPSFADISTQLYGIGVYNANLDYRLNPRKGYEIDIKGSLGNKKIRKNAQINEQLYDGLNLNSTLYTFNSDLALYIPLKKRSVIKLGVQTGYTFNENLFDNELLRIGGLKTLRGVDEEAIFASFYSIQTLEYRFLLEQNSFLYLFTDAAYYEKKTKDNYLSDRPYSFGLGISFETNAGIFSVSYAIGKQFDNPVQFRSAKIHFGFISFF